MTIKQDNWADKYQKSDHHSDRRVYGKLHYEDTCGWDFPEPAPLNRTRMARGRGGSYEPGVVTITRRRQLSLEPDIEFGVPRSRKTQLITDNAAEDADIISHKSRNRDRQLLNDITTRLHRVEFDQVKPRFDVAMKTGFRRKIYHKKLPPLEKETKESMRKDDLRYPWDHTQDNIYRPIKNKKEKVKKSEERAKKATLKTVHDILKEPLIETYYPIYDPMGVYTVRPKRVHKELPSLDTKYDSMNIREKLANVRAKLESMPRKRDASKDVDFVLDDLCRPLPQSQVAGEEMHTIDDFYAMDENLRYEGQQDSIVSDKIKASRSDLQEFDRMLTERFGTKKKLAFADILGRKRAVPPPPPPQFYDYDEEQVSSSNPYADQYPMRSTLPPITRQATVRRTVVTPSRLPESVLFVRAGSLPPPSHSRVEYYEEDIPSLPRVTPLPPRVTPVIKRPVVTQSRPIYRTMSEPPPSYRPIYRAASEPPPYRSLIYDTISEPLRPSVYYYERTPEPLYYPSVYRASDYSYRPTAYRTSPVYQPPPPSVYPTSRPYYRYVGMTPSSQNAVRNAKRYLDKIERELGMEHNGPIMAEPVVIHHVRQPAARVVPRSSVRVATVGSAAPRYRSSSLPPSPRGVPRSSRVAQIEARLEQDSDDYMASPGDKPSETLSSLRTRATNIRNKMDAHKSMMDRYLPIYLGPENEVEYEVDYKFGELVNRMPTLDRHRPFQGSTSTAPVAPYKPASTTKPPSGRAPAARPDKSSKVRSSKPDTNFRPPVSETRKRIREVMCATKKDPHYYD